MKESTKCFIIAAGFLAAYCLGQYIQYVQALQSDEVWTLLSKGKDCGRSCFYWGIFEREGRAEVVNIGVRGLHFYQEGKSYVFGLTYHNFLGIAGSAYTPVDSNPTVMVLSILSVLAFVIFGYAGLDERSKERKG
ncbi:TMhelix containing protein [Vibrio phage 1.244.A._10N.261.54.C3]|nr:TMhelix containing protein [Vibrio phage 1.244.A._10N.261.54.C3]AUR98748.1 TMhelix containing protein [Vibrio phage 1.255.O._10N.286.45.F1]